MTQNEEKYKKFNTQNKSKINQLLLHKNQNKFKNHNYKNKSTPKNPNLNKMTKVKNPLKVP